MEVINPPQLLSDRELDVLELITNGIAHNKGIAVELDITISTVKSHINRMAKKLDIPNNHNDHTKKIKIIRAAIFTGVIDNPFEPSIPDESIIIGKTTSDSS